MVGLVAQLEGTILLLMLLHSILGSPIITNYTQHICYCIGSPPDPNTASKFQILIVDPDETPESLLSQYKEMGRTVLAYINVGYAEDWRHYWNNTLLQKIIHNETEYEGEYYVEYWNSLWLQTVTNYVETYLNNGYDGIYLDNIDAYIVLNESNYTWIQGINLREAMIQLIAKLSTIAKNLTGNQALVYVNIGGALEDLKGGTILADYIDGYLREEVIFYSQAKCVNKRVPPSDWWNQESYLIQGVKAGLDVNVVEFVQDYSEAIYSMLVHVRWGIHVILQPSCDPDYTHPPLQLSQDPTGMHTLYPSK